jgi:hypothetical protein
MTNRSAEQIGFPACRGRKVEAECSGGAVTSDGGALLPRQVDRRLGLTEAAARAVPDDRDPAKVVHSQLSLLRQRVYAIALGHEDLNDHASLRLDPALQTAVERDRELASAPTLCRLEHRAERKAARAIHGVLIERFIASFDAPPEELVLDCDATDDPVHGHQEGRFFHGYSDQYCFLPLYVFCGDQLGLSAPGQPGRGAARLGDPESAGPAAAGGLAQRADRVPGRLGLLPLEDARLGSSARAWATSRGWPRTGGSSAWPPKGWPGPKPSTPAPGKRPAASPSSITPRKPGTSRAG